MDRALGEHFLQSIQPFVWRRSLDFGVIEEVREISARIRDHFAQGASLGPGYDLKRGRGGIREVEFFAQIQQMVHGGRDPSVRASATRPLTRAASASTTSASASTELEISGACAAASRTAVASRAAAAWLPRMP